MTYLVLKNVIEDYHQCFERVHSTKKLGDAIQKAHNEVNYQPELKDHLYVVFIKDII